MMWERYLYREGGWEGMEIREVGDESCQNVYYTCVLNCQTINLTILLAKKFQNK